MAKCKIYLTPCLIVIYILHYVNSKFLKVEKIFHHTIYHTPKHDHSHLTHSNSRALPNEHISPIFSLKNTHHLRSLITSYRNALYSGSSVENGNFYFTWHTNHNIFKFLKIHIINSKKTDNSLPYPKFICIIMSIQFFGDFELF